MTTPLLYYTYSGAAPFIERLTWDTDLQVSLNGTESPARRRRSFPKMEYELTLAEYEAFNAGLLDTQRSLPKSVLLPLWPLAIGPSVPPRAGVSMDGGQQWLFVNSDGSYVLQVPQNGYSGLVSLPLAAPPNDYPRLAPTLPAGGNVVSIVPTVECAIDKLTTYKHSVLGHRDVQLKLRALNFRECPVPFYATLDNGLPVLPASWLEYTDATNEGFDRTENDLQIGTRRVIDLQYTEHTLSIVIALTDPVEQMTLRAFLFAMYGRYGHFRMNHPMTDGMHTYRLMKDAVELDWMPGDYLLTKLTCKQLS